jgi:hypothetical protein
MQLLPKIPRDLCIEPALNAHAQCCLEPQGSIRCHAALLPDNLVHSRDGNADCRSVVQALSAGTEIMEPTAGDWITAGAALARLGGESVTTGRSFWNHALLAAQCARLGATLVTQNAADFRRLHRYVAVHAVPPFPAIVR